MSPRSREIWLGKPGGSCPDVPPAVVDEGVTVTAVPSSVAATAMKPRYVTKGLSAQLIQPRAR
jgi:hypothetical protein